MDMNELMTWTRRVVEASSACLAASGSVEWLLRQSLHTQMQRLAILPALIDGLAPECVLDVGAGTGALSLDLAWKLGSRVQIVAVDTDAQALSVLGCLNNQLGMAIQCVIGSVFALPVARASHDLCISRFLLQHLDHPLKALLAMRQVTRPGGRIAIMEVDDGARLDFPPPEVVVVHLQEVIRQYQQQQGGDRLIGRRLYGLFRAAGLINIQVLAIPRVELGDSTERNPVLEAQEREWYLTYRKPLVQAGLLSQSKFDQALKALESTYTQNRFRYASEFLALGQVPA